MDFSVNLGLTRIASTLLQIRWTKIHYDFLLDKANLKNDEWLAGFESVGRKLFYKNELREGEDLNRVSLPAPRDGTSTLDDFKARYNAFRLLLVDMIVPRIRVYGEVNCQRMVTDLPDCKTMEDYLNAYRTLQYDNKMRRAIHLICNVVWGRHCCAAIENAVMTLLRIEYLVALLSGELKNKRSGGSIAKMTNRIRQTHFVNKFR